MTEKKKAVVKLSARMLAESKAPNKKRDEVIAVLNKFGFAPPKPVEFIANRICKDFKDDRDLYKRDIKPSQAVRELKKLAIAFARLEKASASLSESAKRAIMISVNQTVVGLSYWELITAKKIAECRDTTCRAVQFAKSPMIAGSKGNMMAVVFSSDLAHWFEELSGKKIANHFSDRSKFKNFVKEMFFVFGIGGDALHYAKAGAQIHLSKVNLVDLGLESNYPELNY